MFPCAVCCSCVFDEKFIEVSWFLFRLFFLAKRCVLNVWQCFKYFCLDDIYWLLNNLYSDLILCTASDTFSIMVYSALFFCRYMPAYLIIFSVIKTCAYWNIIKAYSGIFSTLCNPRILTNCHILSLGI